MGFTYSLCDGEHLPASGVDWDESRRQQLPLLCVVASGGVKQLIDTNLHKTIQSVQSKGPARLQMNPSCPTYLAEMMPVECRCCLRSQLEEMQLCSQDLLRSGDRGQVEPELHLLTAHCNGNDIVRHQSKG